jgi:hypothetical protein
LLSPQSSSRVQCLFKAFWQALNSSAVRRRRNAMQVIFKERISLIRMSASKFSERPTNGLLEIVMVNVKQWL